MLCTYCNKYIKPSKKYYQFTNGRNVFCSVKCARNTDKNKERTIKSVQHIKS